MSVPRCRACIAQVQRFCRRFERTTAADDSEDFTIRRPTTGNVLITNISIYRLLKYSRKLDTELP